MSKRPIGAPIVWATDTNFADAGQPWDATPTKVRPVAGEIAAGYYPDRRRPAVLDNFLTNDYGARLRHLDLVDARNFVRHFQGPAATSGNVRGEVARADYKKSRSILYMANRGDDLYLSADGGASWSADINVATSVWQSVRALPGRSVLAVFESGGAGRWTVLGSADETWSTAAAFTGAVGVKVIEPDPYRNVWWIGGQVAGTTPGIWKLTDTLGVNGTMVESTVHPSSPPEDDPIYWIAASPDFMLAANYDSGTTDIGMYQWEDGDANAANHTSPFGGNDEIRSLLWLPTDERFLAVAHQTGGTYGRTILRRCTSTLGAWESLSNLQDVEIVGRGSVIGTTIILPAKVEGHPHLAISGDAGESWEYVPDPLAYYQDGGAVPEVALVCSLGDQFAATGYGGAGEAFMSLSLRLS